MVRCLLGAGIAIISVAAVDAQTAADTSTVTGGDGARIPRYVSLKADNVSVRQGPGTEYPVAWVFKRTGLPVEIIEEAEVWRKVRAADGTEGWVHVSLLSGRRTALVKGGSAQADAATLRDDDREGARAVAQVEAGVLASIISCERGWCRVSVGNYRGHIEQSKLWGTYPNELIKQ
jgi:SH3-like domain-containing protein